jgi:hypothetical protein
MLAKPDKLPSPAVIPADDPQSRRQTARSAALAAGLADLVQRALATA